MLVRSTCLCQWLGFGTQFLEAVLVLFTKFCNATYPTCSGFTPFSSLLQFQALHLTTSMMMIHFGFLPVESRQMDKYKNKISRWMSKGQLKSCCTKRCKNTRHRNIATIIHTEPLEKCPLSAVPAEAVLLSSGPAGKAWAQHARHALRTAGTMSSGYL